MARSTVRLVVLLVGALAVPAWTAPTPVTAQDESFRTDTLAPGVFALIRPVRPDLVAISNHLVIVDDEGVTLVDTGLTPGIARGVLDEIRRLTDRPVRWIVNTHWHDDHVWGNRVVLDAFPDARIVAHPAAVPMIRDSLPASLERNRTEYADALAGYERALRTGITSRGDTVTDAMRRAFETQAASLAWFVPSMASMRVAVPDVEVADRMVLHRPGREIEILFLGRGNTAGDLVVRLPDEGIVFAGDLVVAPVPYGFGSFLGEWDGTLGRLQALGARVIVPGHGEPLRDVAYVEDVRGLLRHTLAEAREAAGRGLDLEATREAVELDAWRARFTGGDPVLERGFDGFWAEPAVERAWLEATGGLDATADTVRLEVGSAALDGRVFPVHLARNRVYVGEGSAPLTTWTNELSLGDSLGRPVMRWITRGVRLAPEGAGATWELEQTYDARTLAPLTYHRRGSDGAWMRLGIDGTRVRGERLRAGDVAPSPVAWTLERPAYFAGASDLVPMAVGLRQGVVATAPVWSPGMDAVEVRVFEVVGEERVRVEGAEVLAWRVDERVEATGRPVATWWLTTRSPFMVLGEIVLADGRVQRVTGVDLGPG